MQRETKVSKWCETILEAGWLLALTLIPIYFNLLSARHFEPDKATTLRSIVLIMVAVALIRVLEKVRVQPIPATPESPPEQLAVNPIAQLWKRLNSMPMLLPVLFYSAVFIIATIFSVVPRTSVMGSYQRLQGTYTNLSYVILFFIMIATIRRREQLERLITVTLITGLMVSFYGVVQHNGLDPLPWKGDVVTRVASTMGNAIFVAAYLIMVVPLALYRVVTGINDIRKAPPPNQPSADIGWAFAYSILIIGTMSLLVAAIKFGSVVRVADFRYWWVFPGAVIVSTALWVLPTLRMQWSDQKQPGGFSKLAELAPGLLFGGYIFLLAPTFLVSSNTGKQQIDESMAQGPSWWVWLLISIGAVIVFYIVAFSLPRQVGQQPSRLAVGLRLSGALLILASLLLTVYYSQSRGPWLGIGAGMFVFFTLLLWLARRWAIQRNVGASLTKLLRITMWLWGIVSLLAAAFIIALNFSQAPVFDSLRQKPFLDRLSTALDPTGGTGRVRTLIWFGDEHGSATVGLITEDPFRTVVGWGPESMFVAFNPFYPPELANIEARGASPDRSHQALLDELVTKGVLGLVSYFFVLLSFAAISWRIIQESQEWHWAILGIACISGVATHFVEGLTGIPIVATLTMLWVTMATAVLGGMFAGIYRLDGQSSKKDTATATQPAEATTEQPETAKTPEAPPQTAKPKKTEPSRSTTKRGSSSGARRSSTARGANAAAARTSTSDKTSRRPTHQATVKADLSAAGIVLYALIMLLTFGAVWWFNLSTVYADMCFHEGETYSAQEGAEIYGLNSYLKAIRNNPTEDFYYLNLGRILMTIAEQKRAAEAPMGQVEQNADVNRLIQLDSLDKTATFIQQQSPLQIMSYAEAVLKRARELNPRNKDHYANLARLNNFWYNWTQDPARLLESAKWYGQANEVAPHDVSLINEHASIQMMLGRIDEQTGQTESSAEHYATAQQLYELSLKYDSAYGDATIRLAELYRLQGNMEQAIGYYIDIINREPHQLDDNIQAIIASLQGERELLTKLRDAYHQQAEAGDDAALHALAGLVSVRAGDVEGAVDSYARAVELDPDNLEYNRNYTIVLSDTKNYAQALNVAQTTVELAQDQEGLENQVNQFQRLIAFFQQMSKERNQ